jgi:erythrocyte band 7 integral membrane protein
MNASRSLKDAADIIAENPQALQLRYLQTLTTISAEKSSTILFPLPMNFLSQLLPKRGKAGDQPKNISSSDNELECKL